MKLVLVEWLDKHRRIIAYGLHQTPRCYSDASIALCRGHTFT